jgi:hypothetical protein
MHHTLPQVRAPVHVPQIYRPEEFQSVELFVEMIIPTEDKSGAKEGQVADCIDLVVFAASENKPEFQMD